MFNRVILIGRAGQDIDVRFTPSGTKIAKFSLATSRSFMDSQGNWQEKTEWHNIALWGRLADKGEKVVRKGGLYLVEGSIEYQTWEDSTGTKKYRTEIRALSLIHLNAKSFDTVKSSFTDNPLPHQSASEKLESESLDNVKEEIEEIEEPADDFVDNMPDEDLPF